MKEKTDLCDSIEHAIFLARVFLQSRRLKARQDMMQYRLQTEMQVRLHIERAMYQAKLHMHDTAHQANLKLKRSFTQMREQLPSQTEIYEAAESRECEKDTTTNDSIVIIEKDDRDENRPEHSHPVDQLEEDLTKYLIKTFPRLQLLNIPVDEDKSEINTKGTELLTRSSSDQKIMASKDIASPNKKCNEQTEVTKNTPISPTGNFEREICYYASEQSNIIPSYLLQIQRVLPQEIEIHSLESELASDRDDIDTDHTGHLKRSYVFQQSSDSYHSSGGIPSGETSLLDIQDGKQEDEREECYEEINHVDSSEQGYDCQKTMDVKQGIGSLTKGIGSLAETYIQDRSTVDFVDAKQRSGKMNSHVGYVEQEYDYQGSLHRVQDSHPPITDNASFPRMNHQEETKCNNISEEKHKHEIATSQVDHLETGYEFDRITNSYHNSGSTTPDENFLPQLEGSEELPVNHVADEGIKDRLVSEYLRNIQKSENYVSTLFDSSNDEDISYGQLLDSDEKRNINRVTDNSAVASHLPKSEGGNYSVSESQGSTESEGADNLLKDSEENRSDAKGKSDSNSLNSRSSETHSTASSSDADRDDSFEYGSIQSSKRKVFHKKKVFKSRAGEPYASSSDSEKVFTFDTSDVFLTPDRAHFPGAYSPRATNRYKKRSGTRQRFPSQGQLGRGMSQEPYDKSPSLISIASEDSDAVWIVTPLPTPWIKFGSPVWDVSHSEGHGNTNLQDASVSLSFPQDKIVEINEEQAQSISKADQTSSSSEQLNKSSFQSKIPVLTKRKSVNWVVS